MSAASAVPSSAAASTVRPALVATRAMARRSALGIIRQPALMVPGLFFPLFFVSLNTAALGRAPGFLEARGFPVVDSMLDFLLATVIVQGVLFGAITSGADLARDIETGFFDRLVASPVPRTSVLVGRLGGAATLAVIQATFFCATLLAFGAEIKGGVAAFVALEVIAVLLALGIGGFAISMALRTGSSEAVQGAFPLFFVLMFTSSAFFPREVMSGWYQDVAGVNPISYLVEGARGLVIDGFELGYLLQALAVCVGMIVLSMSLALGALRRRLREAS